MVLYDTDGRSLSETNIGIATDLITSIINS